MDPKAKLELAMESDTFSSTFNNIDITNQYAAIFPKERTPVVAGVRSLRYEETLEKFPRLMDEKNIVES